MSQIVATDATFEQEVLKSDIPVLVDFSAEWCRPCQAAAPVIAALAEEFAGRVKIVTVDVEDNPKLSLDHGVRGVPNFIIFKGGQRVEQLIGWGDNRIADIRAALDAVLTS